MEVDLKLIDSLFLATSNILYTCECVGRFFKDFFANKIEKQVCINLQTDIASQKKSYQNFCRNKKSAFEN